MAGSALVRRVAFAGAVVTFLLLALGGVVTSRDAGMIFLDWPLSNNSVNPPGWLTNADMFSEHGHRILGALTGMITVALAVLIQRTDKRRWLQGLAWFAVVAVIAQGVLGGIRVTEVSTFLALFHGCTGQIYFCLMVALAYFTGRDFNAPRERGAGGRDTRLVAFLAAGVWLATLVQIILGARIRHIHGPVHNHLLGALIVGGSVLWLASLLLVRHGRGRDGRALRRPALLLLALLTAQVALGLYTADVLTRDLHLSDATFGVVALPSMHQAVGALLIALETVIVLRAWARRAPTIEEVVEKTPRPGTPARAMEPVA
jgi:cytochrome c oxidase assembly protein subunit 15